MATKKKVFEIRVDHELGFYSIYKISSINVEEAEKQAKKSFIADFCGADTKYKLTAFTFNN